MNTEKTPRIGEYWTDQGGFYAGIIRNTATNQQWHLIDSGRTIKGKWGPYETIVGADDFTDGQLNTEAMRNSGHEHPLIDSISEIDADGHKDFYLAAQKENNLVYINLSDKCEPVIHFSSTQYDALNAWFQDFEDGYQYISYKDLSRAARAVRRILIIK